MPLCDRQRELFESVSGGLGRSRLRHDLTEQLVQQLQHFLSILPTPHQTHTNQQYQQPFHSINSTRALALLLFVQITNSVYF